MMVEDRGKDEFSAQNLMKKHEILETSVEDFAATIQAARGDGQAVDRRGASRQRGHQCQDWPGGQAVCRAPRTWPLRGEPSWMTLSNCSCLTARLTTWSNGLPRKREVVAGSHELGQDSSTSLSSSRGQRVRQGHRLSISSERVAASEIADSLISVGHTDAATIAQ